MKEGFTGIYFDIHYYSFLNMVFLYKKGCYDYPEIRTVKSVSFFIKWCWSLKQAKEQVKKLNEKLKKTNKTETVFIIDTKII